jgi:hypothetical protein
MQGAPLDWILQDRRYCNVCIRCIEKDALTGTKPFLRLEWRQAWKTNCSIHGIRLLRTTLNFMADGVHTVDGARECQRLRGKSAALEGTLDRAFATKRKVIAVIRAVERMETAIDRALGGHDPDNRIWGPLSASEFLIVVQDVTTWALSNFECFHARLEAENLPTGVRIVADFYFTMMPRHLSPFASDLSKRSIFIDLPHPCQALGFDVPGQQRLDLLYCLRGGELGEQAAQVRIRFKVVSPRGLD